jgi:hypothetical protein
MIAVFQYGVVVSVTTISESPVDFPGITICNLVSMDVTRANTQSFLAAYNTSSGGPKKPASTPKNMSSIQLIKEVNALSLFF